MRRALMFSKFSRDLTDRSARLAGIGLMLLGVLLFSVGDALGKHIVSVYAVGQLLLLRSIASLILLSPTIWRNRADFDRIERPWLQLFRVSLSSGEVLMFFWATVYLPLADIITFYLASPIFVTAGSAIFLKEHVGWRRWSAVLLGFIGVLIALRPSAQSLTWPALIAITGSILFAIQMIVTRSLRRTSDVVLAASQFVSTLALGAILTAIVGWKTPTSFDFALFLFAGLIAIGALMSVNRSLILAPATVVVPYQYSMIIWAVIFGYVVFDDVPTLHVLVGAAVIIAAGFYIFLRERSHSKEEPVVVPPPA
ncbi:MAG: DMT family transporter [Pseudomonadota bacterium]